jgi:hypothetical protein
MLLIQIKYASEARSAHSRLRRLLAGHDTSQGIAFDDVGFRYRGREEWAVRHVNLRIGPGERIALAFRLAAARQPSGTELKILESILAEQYAIQAWPTYFLINREGNVAWGFENDAPAEKWIEALLKP